MTNNPAIVEAAVEYARLGYTPVPVWGLANGVCQCPRGADCSSTAKHPRGAGWGDYATSDPEAVAQVFGNFPGCNVGLLLGPASGLIDIEFDSEEGELTAMRLFNGGQATPTYYSKRSTHRLYKFRDTGVGKAVVTAAGLEVRLGDGGKAAQSVAPPSLHASGQRYEWYGGLHPRHTPLAELPQAVVDLVLAAHGKPSQALETLTFEPDLELSTHQGAKEGERNAVFCRLLGAHLARHGIGPELHQLAADWAGRCQPPWPLAEMQRSLLGLLAREQAKAAQPRAPRGISARRYDAIEQRDVSWLWQGRIALGKLTLIAGQPGVGKTFLCCDLASRVSSGRPFPDGASPTLGDVAILTYEDDASDTLKPRLVAAGADCSRIHHIDAAIDDRGREASVSLDAHLASLEQWLGSLPELRLLVIDPISAALGKTDGNANSDVRGVLGPVAKLAERYGLAVVGISHLAKGDRKPIHAVLGSIAFVAAARAVWLVGRDPDDEQRRLFLPVKNNIGDCQGLAYRLLEGRCEWEAGEVTIAADELEATGETPRHEAAQWLRQMLAEGAQPQAKLLAAARGQAISRSTLYRARGDLKVISAPLGGELHWSLPEAIQPDPTDAEGYWIVPDPSQ